MRDSFSLLTLNCFGLWLPNTKRRLVALARELEQSPYQVICLQEIQLHQYRNLLVRESSSYPHALDERYIHCPMGGLLTLSRLPVTNSLFEPYVERGLWYTPMLLDRLFHKGMLITRVIWANIPMVIINTHLLANFAGDWERNGIYARVEEKQLQQLAEMVQAQPKESIVLVAGDFNIPRGSWLYQDFLASSGLTDPLAGDTRPTLRLPHGAPARLSLPIDYIFVRIPAKYALDIDCDHCFSTKYPVDHRRQGYLSDHIGLEIRIQVN